MEAQQRQGSRFETNHDLQRFVILRVIAATIVAEPCPIVVSPGPADTRACVERLL